MALGEAEPRRSLGFSPDFLHYPTIGHSANSPCPNLKKLGEPASTTAMMATFLPCFIAAIGWGRLPGISFTGCCAVFLRNGHNDNENQEIKVAEPGIRVTFPPASRTLGRVLFIRSFPWCLSPPPLAGGFCRMRGIGGGTSGNTSNSAVNSAKDGIWVVLALCNG